MPILVVLATVVLVLVGLTALALVWISITSPGADAYLLAVGFAPVALLAATGLVRRASWGVVLTRVVSWIAFGAAATVVLLYAWAVVGITLMERSDYLWYVITENPAELAMVLLLTGLPALAGWVLQLAVRRERAWFMSEPARG